MYKMRYFHLQHVTLELAFQGITITSIHAHMARAHKRIIASVAILRARKLP